MLYSCTHTATVGVKGLTKRHTHVLVILILSTMWGMKNTPNFF